MAASIPPRATRAPRDHIGWAVLVIGLIAWVASGKPVSSEVWFARVLLIGVAGYVAFVVAVAFVNVWLSQLLFRSPPNSPPALYRRIAWCGRWLGKLTGQPAFIEQELYAWNFLGDRRAADAGDRLLAMLHDAVCPWQHVNDVVNAWITLGRYRDALDLPERWSEEARREGTKLRPGEAALVQVNLVEAEYCLGLLDEAAARLEQSKALVESDPVPRMGHRLQSAWVAVLQGRVADARRHVDDADASACPRPYLPEVHFTRAFVALAENDFEQARRETKTAMNLAVRASSFRNGLFLLGRIDKAEGHTANALVCFEAAIEHPYRDQGGDGLLAYADLLRELGRMPEAEAAYQMVCDRDPECSASEAARERMQELRGECA